MKTQAVKIHGTMIITPDAKPLTAELASHAFFGLPLADLLREMKENRGGKYDCIYSDKPIKVG